MALADYAQLQDAIKGWLWDREDLAGRVPEFITFAEADFNDELRVGQMELSATVTLTNGVGPLPNDYLAWRRVMTQDSPVRVLEFADPAWAEDHYVARAAEPAWHFTISGSTIKTYPTSVPNLTLLYYQKIPSLSSSNVTNWLLTRKPQAYLYGALVHAAPFLDDDERLQTYGALRKVALDSLRETDVVGRYGKAVARPPGATP
jgi:hypothetical protein